MSSNAVLEPEPRPGGYPVAVTAQVDGDDAEVPREGGEDLSPVQFGREGHPVDEHERFGARGAGALPHPRDPAARQLHQAGTRSRGLPEHLPHSVTLLRCRSAGASDGTRPTIHHCTWTVRTECAQRDRN